MLRNNNGRAPHGLAPPASPVPSDESETSIQEEPEPGEFMPHEVVPYIFRLKDLITTIAPDRSSFDAQYLVTPRSWCNFFSVQAVEILGLQGTLRDEQGGPLRGYKYIRLVLRYRGGREVAGRFYVLKGAREFTIGGDTGHALGIPNVWTLSAIPSIPVPMRPQPMLQEPAEDESA